MTARWFFPTISVLLLASAAVAAAPKKAAPRPAVQLPEPPQPRSRAEVEAALAKAPSLPAEGQLRPIHIVLLADTKDHGPEAHDYPLWQKRWALLLGGRQGSASTESQANLFGPPSAEDADRVAAGAPQVKVTTAWQWPSPEQFRSADLLVMFCYRSGGKPRCWSDERISELGAFLTRGGGFVPIHSPTYAASDLTAPEAAQELRLTGVAFDKSILVRHGLISLQLTATQHPICLGLPTTIQLFDEPYWPPVGDVSKVEALATSQEAIAKNSEQTASQPMFWTYRCGKGRVFACVPGHFTWTFDDPYFRILLLRGMAWAAGESPYRFDPLVLRAARVQ
jgi:type 1 glutamine amidotransferase